MRGFVDEKTGLGIQATCVSPHVRRGGESAKGVTLVRGSLVRRGGGGSPLLSQKRKMGHALGGAATRKENGR